jgi:uncharacterized protein YvpB
MEEQSRPSLKGRARRLLPRPWPTPVLVGFWLVIILLAAGGLAVIADRAALHTGAAQLPAVAQAAALTTVVATPTAPHPTRSIAAAAVAGVVSLGRTATPEATRMGSTPAAAPPALPESVLLQEAPAGKQTRPLNCEFQTASDLAWYYGQPFTWEEIFQVVGHDVGGNPHKGFVGRSFDDKPGQVFPKGYGVYAEPIAEGFARLGIEAAVSYGNEPQWLMAQLAAGRPVMVWTTAGMTIRPVATWTAADGVNVKGVPGEHTYLAVGYDPGGVWLMDPYDGRRHYFEWPVFVGSWDLLDRMALTVTQDPRQALVPTPGP